MILYVNVTVSECLWDFLPVIVDVKRLSSSPSVSNLLQEGVPSFCLFLVGTPGLGLRKESWARWRDGEEYRVTGEWHKMLWCREALICTYRGRSGLPLVSSMKVHRLLPGTVGVRKTSEGGTESTCQGPP